MTTYNLVLLVAMLIGNQLGNSSCFHFLFCFNFSCVLQRAGGNYYSFQLIFIGVQLLHNVVLLFAIQKSESAIHVYIYLLFFGFPFHLCHDRALRRVPSALLYQRFSLAIYFMQSIAQSVPISQFIPISSSVLGNYQFVPYVCDSISALQISLSIPFQGQLLKKEKNLPLVLSSPFENMYCSQSQF